MVDAPISNADHTIQGHTIGSRHFGKLRGMSDWDFCFADTPEVRSFLKASGFICTVEYKEGEVGATTSFWRQTHYSTELFLVKSEKERRVARSIMWWLQWTWIFKSKPHRNKLWHTLEIAFRSISEIRKHYLAGRLADKEKSANEVRLRYKPLQEKDYGIHSKLR